jgi:hypothetical protein
MTRPLYGTASLALLFLAVPLRAANGPHAGTDRQEPMVWTNDDLERLHVLSPISIVGRMDEETPKSPSLPQPHVKTRDPEWYAAQAAMLRDDLEQRQAQLREFRLSLDDARSLKETTGGIRFDNDDIAITPDAGIEILEQRVSEAQTELDALDDLARHNYIPPGTLRGQ